MRDKFSLDQIRAFIAAVEEGSFSAAARRLGCAQSAVSDLIRRLEEETGVQLFSRATRSPTLTVAGKLLLADARSITAAANKLNSRALSMARGLESELCVVVDVYFPFHVIAEVSKDFRAAFPEVPLRLYVEILGGVLTPVLERRASLAVGAPTVSLSLLTAEKLCEIELIPVAAPSHPLGRFNGEIPREELAEHVQLVLTERSTIAPAPDYNVLSPLTWRLTDFFAKHSFLLEGLGWGFVPRHAVGQDIAEGRLKTISLEGYVPGNRFVSMSAIYRGDTPPGPAGRWMIGRLRSASARLNKRGGPVPISAAFPQTAEADRQEPHRNVVPFADPR